MLSRLVLITHLKLVEAMILALDSIDLALLPGLVPLKVRIDVVDIRTQHLPYLKDNVVIGRLLFELKG